MSSAVQPVILCGGSGERLWPLSRTGFPKPFLCFGEEQSLFQRVVSDFHSSSKLFEGLADPIVVSGEQHRFLVLEQLRECGVSAGSILLEPVGRNTAPALTIAALNALHFDEDPVLLVLPADQSIVNSSALSRSLNIAIEAAEAGGIVILGIKPTEAATGFGYIRVEECSNLGIQKVLEFIEKPNELSAIKYVNSGNYLWNAGIFVLRASAWTESIKRFNRDVFASCHSAWTERTSDKNFTRPGAESFSLSPSESVDKAVLERVVNSATDLKVVGLDSDWMDLGTWNAIWKHLPKDVHGNAVVGDVLIQDSCDSLIWSSERLIASLGLKDMIVIETNDALLVANKDRSQDIKGLLNLLSQLDRNERKSHRKVHRPWGWYDAIESGQGFKVKRICVNPYSKISLQKHVHRAEHWVVIKGVAEITLEDQKFTLAENQSTFIPQGRIHRIANPDSIPLEIIEIQTGNYLEEDDIIRLEDDYGR